MPRGVGALSIAAFLVVIGCFPLSGLSRVMESTVESTSGSGALAAAAVREMKAATTSGEAASATERPSLAHH